MKYRLPNFLQPGTATARSIDQAEDREQETGEERVEDAAAFDLERGNNLLAAKPEQGRSRRVQDIEPVGGRHQPRGRVGLPRAG
jgi:hypothetical protein